MREGEERDAWLSLCSLPLWEVRAALSGDRKRHSECYMFVTVGDIGICHATFGNTCNNPLCSREYETKRDFENERDLQSAAVVVRKLKGWIHPVLSE